MRVKLDFDQMYETQADPWGIGQADTERYDLYRARLLEHTSKRQTILDIGCGMGAFLARFGDDFEQLVGVEVTAAGVEKGRERFPFIEFRQGSAFELGAALPSEARYDAIIYSDVINYFTEKQKRASLGWIAEHLSEEGVALIAAYSPGGSYLDPSEFERLVEHHLAIEDEFALASGHVGFICRTRRTLVAITLDYETWQPIPEGEAIDWEADIFVPTARVLDACEAEGVPLTIMAEIGEYFWLTENEPALATRMEEQWRDAVRRGHDLQLHLHLNWLPELGARRENGAWSWDSSMARAADYPGDLERLIGRCKEAIEATVPGHGVTCFRAGSYEAQPFSRLHDALQANRIHCDSSVLPGDRRPDRGYDYTLAYSDHQPYFASRRDPQLKAPPAEQEIVELPAFVLEPGRRWTFDGPEGVRFAGQLLDHRRRAAHLADTARFRRRQRLKARLGELYWRLREHRRLVNRLMPRRLAHFIANYGPERLTGDEYFVMVGHSKSHLDMDAIRDGLRTLRENRCEFLTLSEMAERARRDLARSVNRTAEAEARRGVQRGYLAAMGTERNPEQSEPLQRMIPFDRGRILDLGCGDGTWSRRIAELYPWVEVIGIDAGADFIDAARDRYAGDRVSFATDDFGALSFDDASFDCAYADNVLEHAFDVDATLREVHRVLLPGGVLVAAIPSDARAPGRICDKHTWKTAPGDVRGRLEVAGFEGISIEEVDSFRELGAAPFPPSDDRLMYVRAWKPPFSEHARATELTRWAYRVLSPERMHDSSEPIEILARGHAWCWGYVLVLGEALRREGYRVRWVTMVAAGHQRGRGRSMTETHEVIEVESGEASRQVLDPMAGVVFEASAEELVARPELADTERDRDERYRQRGYDLYATSEWYAKVVKLSVNGTPRKPRRWTRARKLRSAVH